MNGFLIADKSAGISSYDVIRRLKRLATFTKIGYIGTLDRNATGVLPVAMNEGVKLIPFFENQVKTYRANILLGITTDTLDVEGKVLTTATPDAFDEEVVKKPFREIQRKNNTTGSCFLLQENPQETHV